MVKGQRKESIGRAGFAELAEVETPHRKAQVEKILAHCAEEGLTSIRLGFADQHGVLRSKTIVANALAAAFKNGCTMTSTLLAKDTSHKTVFSVWQEESGLGTGQMQGAGDFIMLPDPDTFKILPWAHKTGWLLCDIYFCNGRPIPFSTRQILKNASAELASRNQQLQCGLEVEFHVFKLLDPMLDPQDAGQVGQPGAPRSVQLLGRGFQYLTEQRFDEIEPVMEILRQTCVDLDLPLRSMENEFGPSQFEMTFDPSRALVAADNMMLFRSAVKQVCQRHGWHATFMCRPHLQNIFSSGWHLHQSLIDSTSGTNLFSPQGEAAPLSRTGLCFMGGLLKHAAAATLFACPTINGYKRYQPYALAPDRICWGRDNKGAMIRAIGDEGDPAARIENRIGEPAANPYLYIASQIYAGLDGIDNELDPGRPTETPYDCDAEKIPVNIMAAIGKTEKSGFFAECFGQQFIDYYLHIKHAEFNRFMANVTDWDQREYFDIY